MEVKAQARFVRIAPLKARVVVDLIRGKNVEQAREVLRFTNKAAAEIVEKVLNSAVANAENAEENSVDRASLIVKEAVIGEGPTLKRFQPKARGSAGHIRKRTSHIRIIVSDEI